MKRRHFIELGFSSLAACASGLARSNAFDGIEGCCLRLGELEAVIPNGETTFYSLNQKNPIIPASGDPSFDKALGRQLAKLANLFGVCPGFGYYNDHNGSNAYASPQTQISGTKGTVLFGLNLLQSILKTGKGSDIAILGICAHEFAHILQMFSGIREQLRYRHRTVKLVELHADYLAGYFIGLFKQEKQSITLFNLGNLINNMGDTEFNHPNHHGTPDERIRAIETGFKASFSTNSMAIAVMQGSNFVIQSFS